MGALGRGRLSGMAGVLGLRGSTRAAAGVGPAHHERICRGTPGRRAGQRRRPYADHERGRRDEGGGACDTLGWDLLYPHA